MVAFHNGHKLNRKSTDLAQTPRLPTTHHQHHQLPPTTTTTTATTMGEQRQQHKRQVGWLHFVLSRGGGEGEDSDRPKEATASMQSPSLRCYINLIQAQAWSTCIILMSKWWQQQAYEEEEFEEGVLCTHFKKLAFLESIVSGTPSAPKGARGTHHLMILRDEWRAELRFLHTLLWSYFCQESC